MAVSTSAADHFDAVEFDQFLADHGTPAIWRRARTCPCFDPRTGHAQVDCPFCEHGLSIIWEDPGTPLIVLAPGRDRREQYDQAGLWMQGMVMLTFPSTVTPGHLDQIVMTAASMVVNRELHTRGEQDRKGRSRERLRFPSPVAIEFCEAIVSDDLVNYHVPSDFTLDANGAILWQPDQGPPAGTQYALRYTARPTFVVWAPRERDEFAQKMPYRAMTQRLDFFRQQAVGEA